jgi:methylated-DNA-[protein]-cysteine S-methyltransferase
VNKIFPSREEVGQKFLRNLFKSPLVTEPSPLMSNAKICLRRSIFGDGGAVYNAITMCTTVSGRRRKARIVRSPKSAQVFHSLLDTPIGVCGIAWNERGIVRFQLPERDAAATAQRLRGRLVIAREATPGVEVAQVIKSMQKYLAGDRVDFSAVSLDFSGVPDFHRKVYRAARAVKWGQTATYGQLAAKSGSPDAARAVGQAMSRNPLAILIPCHRILAAGKKMGGFSAFGGTSVKEKLLALEGIFPP